MPARRAHDHGAAPAEAAPADAAAPAAAHVHEHDEDAWAPADGFERFAYTAPPTSSAASASRCCSSRCRNWPAASPAGVRACSGALPALPSSRWRRASACRRNCRPCPLPISRPARSGGSRRCVATAAGSALIAFRGSLAAVARRRGADRRAAHHRRAAARKPRIRRSRPPAPSVRGGGHGHQPDLLGGARRHRRAWCASGFSGSAGGLRNSFA